MKNQHLTDTEVQEYVVQNDNCNTYITEHIQQCENCKLKAEQYKVLLEGINHIEKPVFDFSLVDLVIEKLPVKESANYNENWFYFFITAIIAVPTFIIIHLFGNNVLTLLSDITPIIIGLSITTVACVFIFLCIDLNRRFQKRMNALNIV